jgi:NAD(P)H-flavin reductase
MERTAVRGRLTWQAATVASVTRETASVVTIELEPPDWPGHRAGQHLEVRLTAEDGYQAERQAGQPGPARTPLSNRSILIQQINNPNEQAGKARKK